MTKTCHHCGTAFPGGLTCPGCGAFIPDPPPELLDEAAPSTFPTWAVDRPAPATPADSVASEGAEAERSYPSWATEPEPTPSTDAERAAPAYPARATPTADAPPPPPPPPPLSPPSPPSTSAGPTWAVPAGADRPPSSLASRLGVSSSHDSPTSSGSSSGSSSATNRTALLVLAGVVAVLVVLGGIALIARPGASSDATAVVGTCFVYDASRVNVDKAVACDDGHDGKVLASVTDRTTCPGATTAVLTRAGDEAGTSGVLCIAEPG